LTDVFLFCFLAKLKKLLQVKPKKPTGTQFSFFILNFCFHPEYFEFERNYYFLKIITQGFGQNNSRI